MAADDTPFLSRWSRRKVLVREGVPVADVPPVVTLTPPTVQPLQPVPSLAVPAQAEADAPVLQADTPPADPPPTLADVAALTTDSDYTRFVAQGVTPEVKNAALKKLFTDPHFNVMDGLDTYIDDYSKPDPLPAGMLRQMVQSKLLGLFDDEEENPPMPALPAAAPLDAAEPAPRPAPQPAPLPAPIEADEDLALQLQPDPAAGCAGLAPGAGQDAGRQH